MTSRAYAALVIFTLHAIAASGCSEKTPTSPYRTTGSAVIARNTYIVAGGGGVSLGERIGDTYILSYTGLRPLIAAGDIIVGTERGGYIRRVTSVSKQPGRLVLETAWASLIDAVHSCSIDTTVYMGLGSPGSSGAAVAGLSVQPEPELVRHTAGLELSGGGLKLSGMTLYAGEVEGTQVSVAIQEGRVEFNPDVHIYLRITGGAVEEFAATVTGQLDIDLEAVAQASGPVTVWGEILLASLQKTLVQYRGDFPVVERVTLSFSAGFEYSCESAGSLLAGSTGTFDLLLGAAFNGRAWSGTGESIRRVEPNEVDITGTARTGLRIYAQPHLQVMFYSAGGPDIECEPYLDFASAVSTPPVIEWTLDAGLHGRFGFHPGILDYGLLDCFITPIDYRSTIDSGPYATDSYLFLAAWGGQGDGDGEFDYPTGIAAGQGARVYVVDNVNHRVQVFEPGGAFVSSWGGYGTVDGLFKFPTKAAVDADGNVYVSDSGNKRIQKFAQDGTFLIAWGSEGSGDSQFGDPRGIAVDDGAHVYVVDTRYNRVQKFASDGDFITSWGGYGIRNGQFDTPTGIAVDAAGNVYVTECHNHRVQVFTSDGDFVNAWGVSGDGDGQFDCPIDIAADSRGAVYVADYGSDRIQKLSHEGVFITKLGSSGSDEGQFDRPEGIAVDGDGAVYVVDSRNNRIQKFIPRATPAYRENALR